MGVVAILRIGYLVNSAGILALHCLPWANRFATYGARGVNAHDKKSDDKVDKKDGTSTNILDRIANVRVPHSLFWHFYAFAVVLNLVYGWQILTRGPLFEALAGPPRLGMRRGGMSGPQACLTWTLMLAQEVRRLYESLYLFGRKKQSATTSTMWIGHWLIGIWFFVFTPTATWIEGAGMFNSDMANPDALRTFKLAHALHARPSLKTLVTVPVFLVASGVQHDCHYYLGSLKRYTLPMHPLFQHATCPHYTAEMVIYLALAVQAAPRGQLFNETLLCCFVWTVVNLGVVATRTRAHYIQQYGQEAAGRAVLLPGVY